MSVTVSEAFWCAGRACCEVDLVVLLCVGLRLVFTTISSSSSDTEYSSADDAAFLFLGLSFLTGIMELPEISLSESESESEMAVDRDDPDGRLVSGVSGMTVSDSVTGGSS